MTCRDAERLGVKVRDRAVDYRIVKLAADFYRFRPGANRGPASQPGGAPGIPAIRVGRHSGGFVPLPPPR